MLQLLWRCIPLQFFPNNFLKDVRYSWDLIYKVPEHLSIKTGTSIDSRFSHIYHSLDERYSMHVDPCP